MLDTAIRVHEVTFCSRVAKWISCSTSGSVSFSTEVLSQPPAFREWVTVRELLHLKVRNHRKLFKSLLRACLPDYESIHPET